MSAVRGTSPLIDAYLDELDDALTHVPTDERYEIRSSIEEHIADHTAGRNPLSDDDARRVIRELGPVSAIVPPDQRDDGAARTGVQVSVPSPGATPVEASSASTPGPNSSRIAIMCGALPFALMAVFALFAIPVSGSVTVG